jgi:DNA-binding phage protein
VQTGWQALRSGGSPVVSRVLVIALAAGCALSASPAAWAKEQTSDAAGVAAQASRPTDAQLLDDFAHYVQVARHDLAESVGAELLAREVSAKDFAALVEAGDVRRFESAAQRALKFANNQGLQQVAAKLLKQFELGLLARARDPEQIAKNIQNLTGNLRAKLLGRNGLLQAGEYAMVQLLDALLQDKDPALAVETQQVMIDLGRQAIVPLTTAVMGMPPAQQEKVVQVLGRIPYKTSLPTLVDLRATSGNASVQAECDRAISNLGGVNADAPALYRELAEAYYNEKSEVTSFPGEEQQLLWSYDPRSGLAMNGIATPVFHEAMAMRNLERGLELESGAGQVNADSLALWVASNYSREFDTPQGYVNPAYPTSQAAEAGATPRRGADYFGVAAGSDVAQRVLARALRDKDTPLARKALGAVEQTAGGKLAMDASSTSPLAAALLYPNRRVQTEAALAIAAALPANTFGGAERVVPTLAAAVTASTDKFAAVLAPDPERYQTVRAILEKAGFKVLPQGGTLSDIETALAETPTIDLVVATGFAGERSAGVIAETRGLTKTSAAPVLLITSPEVYAEQQRRFETDRTIAIRPVGTPEAAITATVADLVERASGGAIDKDEAEAYAFRSLAALRDLAVAESSVLGVKDATGVLMGVLSNSTGSKQALVAEVLSRIDQDRAQRSLMDAAFGASGGTQISLMDAVASSAKRFGSKLDQDQVARVVELAGAEDEVVATAAASLMGALSLPNKDLVPLILNKSKS